jgi:hypothetical protein
MTMIDGQSDRTLGDVRREVRRQSQLDVPLWLIRKWYDTGALGIPHGRVGALRVVRAADLEAVVARVVTLNASHRRILVPTGEAHL